MFNFNKIKLRYWIILGYSIPVLCLILSTYVVLFNVGKAKRSVAELDASTAINARLHQLALDIQTTSKTTRGYLLAKSNISKDAYQLAREDYRRSADELKEIIRDGRQKENFEELISFVNQLDEINQELIERVDAGNVKEAVEQWQRESGRAQSQRIADLLEEMLEREGRLVLENKEIQDLALDTLTKVVWIATIMSVLLSVVVGWLLISKMLVQMNEEARTIATSSIEISTTIEQQERVATQQAASVNETTTTMDELKASSRQSAEQAEAAAAGVRRVLMLASGDMQFDRQSFNGKSSLKQKSQQISQQVLSLSEQLSQIYSITNVVGGLANQTNMLALNAAVEAVRAGEAGKGFGVVAAEIRKLADESRKSAEKINAILGDIQKATSSTVLVTEEGTKAVDEMAIAINEIAVNVQQISLNAQQQANAIAQVMTAMNAINAGSREMANGISQTRIGTQSLNQTAQNLKELV